MRIAFAHYSTEDDIGGASTWLIRLASELRRQGWPVAVFLPLAIILPEAPSLPRYVLLTWRLFCNPS